MTLSLDFDDLTTDIKDNVADLIGEGAYEIGGGPFNWGQDRVEADVKQLFRVPVPLPDLSDALALFQEYLGWIPLDGLRQFRNLLPGATDSDFVDAPTAVQFIINSLTDKPLIQILLGLLQSAITGVTDAGLETVESFFTNLRDFIGENLNDIAFDVQQARQSFVTNVVEPLLSAVQGLDQELRDTLTGITDSTITDVTNWLNGLPSAADVQQAYDDAVADARQAVSDELTGITNSTPTDLQNWVLGLLTGTSDLDAAKLVNLANIGMIAESKIIGLTAALAEKLDPTSTLDAAQIVNLANIGLIGQDKILNLTTDLADKLTSASALNADNLLSGTLPAARIAAASITNAMLAASGFDAAKLTVGTLPIARIASGAITDAKLASGISGSKLTGTVAASLISGALTQANIPTLDQTKVLNLVSDLATINANWQAGDTAAIASARQKVWDDLTGITSSTQTDLTNWINSLGQQAIAAIRPEWLGQVPVSSISNVQPNLLWNGEFTDPISIGAGTGFVHDATVGETVPLGSAKVTFNGTNKTPMYGNEVYAKEGDVLTFTGKARTSGATVSGGDSLELYAVAFRSNDTAIVSTKIGGITNQTGWTTISGNFTAPAETAYVATMLYPRSFATAGTGWFDNCTVIRSGLLDGDWVGGLGITLKADVEQLFKDMIAKFFNVEDPDFTPSQAEVKDAMGNIFELISSQSAILSTLQAKFEASQSSGNSLSVDFSDFPNNTVLPTADYDVSYTGTGTAIWGTRNGAAGWYNEDSNNKVARTRVKTVRSSGDNFLIRATLKDLPQNGGGKVSAVCRLTTDWNNYLYARGYSTGFLQYKCDLGCVVNGVEYPFVTGQSLSWNTTMTIYFGLVGQPRRYQIFSGSSKVVDYDETTRPGGVISVLPSAQGTPDNFKFFGMLAERIGSKNCGSLSAFSMSEPI